MTPRTTTAPKVVDRGLLAMVLMALLGVALEAVAFRTVLAFRAQRPLIGAIPEDVLRLRQSGLAETASGAMFCTGALVLLAARRARRRRSAPTPTPGHPASGDHAMIADAPNPSDLLSEHEPCDAVIADAPSLGDLPTDRHELGSLAADALGLAAAFVELHDQLSRAERFKVSKQVPGELRRFAEHANVLRGAAARAVEQLRAGVDPAEVERALRAAFDEREAWWPASVRFVTQCEDLALVRHVGLLIVSAPAHAWRLRRRAKSGLVVDKLHGGDLVDLAERLRGCVRWGFSPDAGGEPADRAEAWLDRQRAQPETFAEDAEEIYLGPIGLAQVLRYDDATDEAPVLVRRTDGAEASAEWVRRFERCHPVAIRFNEEIANELLALDLGEPIPPSLYEPIANYVRRVQERDERVH